MAGSATTSKRTAGCPGTPSCWLARRLVRSHRRPHAPDAETAGGGGEGSNNCAWRSSPWPHKESRASYSSSAPRSRGARSGTPAGITSAPSVTRRPGQAGRESCWSQSQYRSRMARLPICSGSGEDSGMNIVVELGIKGRDEPEGDGCSLGSGAGPHPRIAGAGRVEAGRLLRVTRAAV